MFRSSDDSAVTYTTDDLVLFRESPFAAWMERLTLENPDHGITPDAQDPLAGHHTESLDDIVATLRAEGRNVAVIDTEAAPSERFVDTEVAMRGGADFIVNAFLSEGTVAATAGLLMRTSGYSDLGDYLYIPCEARPLDLRHSSFRLCVLADLLQVAQGQLPPQMLIISGGADLTPLQTEDHIYYYRTVKARFLESMAEFRKHRMPDPAESAFFGRWSACAGEVLKQRAQRDSATEDEREREAATAQQAEEPVVIEEIVVELPRVQVAGGAPQSFYSSDQDTPRSELEPGIAEAGPATLAEQASLLAPDSFVAKHAPGHTPNLARVAPLRPVEDVVLEKAAEELQEEPGEPDQGQTSASTSGARDTQGDAALAQTRRTADTALENLEFIGSGPASLMGPEPLIDVTGSTGGKTAVPDPALGSRESFEPESPWPEPEPAHARTRSSLPDLEPREPVLLPPEPTLVESAGDLRPKSHPLDSQVESAVPAGSPMIDMDGAPAPSLSPVPGPEPVAVSDEDSPLAGDRDDWGTVDAGESPLRQFSSSLQTADKFEDPDES